MARRRMPRIIDALSARTRFGELMDEVERDNTRLLVTRRGKAKVVILSVEDYFRNILKAPRALAEVQLSAKRAGLDAMTDEEIEKEVRAARKGA